MRIVKYTALVCASLVYTSNVFADTFTVGEVTHYRPSTNADNASHGLKGSVEGGTSDAHGNTIWGNTTMEDYCAGSGGYVTVAMDESNGRQGQYLSSAQFPGVVFRVMDTGGYGKGKGDSWMDIASRSVQQSYTGTKNNVTFSTISPAEAAQISQNKSGGACGSYTGDGAAGAGSGIQGTYDSQGNCVPLNPQLASMLGYNNTAGGGGQGGGGGMPGNGACMSDITNAAASHVGQGAADCKIAVAEVLGKSGYWNASQQQTGTNTYANNWRGLLSSNGFNCVDSNSVSCETINAAGGAIYGTERQGGSGHVAIAQSCSGGTMTVYSASIGANAHQMWQTTKKLSSIDEGTGGYVCFPNSSSCA